MLRTGLIGLPSVGKTTLFQLMTSQPDAPRGAHGRPEAAIGVARVPDARLDRADRDVQAAQAGARDGRVRGHPGGRRAAPPRRLCSTWRRTATRTRSCTWSARSGIRRSRTRQAIESAPATRRAMEDELILADLARRREAARSAREGPQEGPDARARTGARRPGPLPGLARAGRRRCGRSNWPTTIASACADSSSCRPSRCCRHQRGRGRSGAAVEGIARPPMAPAWTRSCRARPRVPCAVCAKIELRDRAARSGGRARRFSPISASPNRASTA